MSQKIVAGNPETKEKILQAGKEVFLEKGFKSAAMRDIAARAGVTTGAIYSYYPDKSALFDALVAEHATALHQIFMQAQVTFDALPSEVKAKIMHGYTDHEMGKFIDYIYDHFDAFKLIVCCSAGTKYEHFIDSLVEVEVEYTQRFMQAVRETGKPIPEIDREMNHILSSASYYGIFETVVHDMPKERALAYIDTLTAFFGSGWDKIMGLI